MPTAIAATAVRAPGSLSRRIRRSATIPSTTPDRRHEQREGQRERRQRHAPLRRRSRSAVDRSRPDLVTASPVSPPGSRPSGSGSGSATPRCRRTDCTNQDRAVRSAHARSSRHHRGARSASSSGAAGWTRCRRRSDPGALVDEVVADYASRVLDLGAAAGRRPRAGGPGGARRGRRVRSAAALPRRPGGRGDLDQRAGPGLRRPARPQRADHDGAHRRPRWPTWSSGCCGVAVAGSTSASRSSTRSCRTAPGCTW